MNTVQQNSRTDGKTR